MSDRQDKLGLGNEDHDSKVETYTFEPIKGYPMLNWRGKRPFTSTQFYPAQVREIYGSAVDGWRDRLLWGDNDKALSHLLQEFRGRVDLVYIDPPFDSKVDYSKTVGSKKSKQTSTSVSAFEEVQYSDIWNNDGYLQFMYERLVLIRELLAPDGSIFLHCDWHKSHYLRCIMDEVFGPSNFINEIVWAYHGPGSPGMRQFNRKHDNIFWYSKTQGRWCFNADDIRTPHDEKTSGNFKQGLQGSGFIDGKYELAEGKIPEDWWIMAIAGRYPNDGVKRTGYPTEKPLKLLERIVASASPENGLVLDAFMGSGATGMAARSLGRRFIGIDMNLTAVVDTKDRFIRSGAERGFEIVAVNNYDFFRNPVEAKRLLIEALAIQEIAQNNLYDGEKDGRMVKIMPINRIATKADLSELVAGFDQKIFQRRQDENPRQPVEKILLVCMGHEPDLKAQLELQAKPFNIDVSVVDILRDKSQLEFKRDAEAKVAIRNGELVIENFYPMNLLQKLSLQQEQVGEWRELVDSVMVDWNYDGAVLQPAVIDVPSNDDWVVGRYTVPADAGTIRIKITDLLSESWEGNIDG